MIFRRTRIETANLERGMYVSQLDRPWLETPFLFQGFEIREDSELKLLRKFCRHVYIDVTRCTLPRERVLTALQRHDLVPAAERGGLAGAPSASFLVRLMQAVAQLDPTGAVAARLGTGHRYRNQVPTAEEAPAAIRAYDAATAAMTEVLEQVRTGAGIDVERVRGAAAPLIDSVLRNHDAMAWLAYLRKRDEYACQHSVASAVWAVLLGCQLGFDRRGLDTLAMGGMLLDIGKAKLPASLLGRTGPLSGAELAAMRKHVAHGVELARLTIGINADVLAMIGGHHERADGTGYPQGLKGADIPVFARIAGLVDCYDAMTSPRPWAAALSPCEAVREINGLAGTQFQQEMVEHFVQALGVFPSGSVVELNSGEAGIVIEQHPQRRLRPRVLLLLDAQRRPRAAQEVLDLGRLPSDQRLADARWIARGHGFGAFGLDPKNYFIT